MVKITDAQRRQLDEQGYFRLDGVFSREEMEGLIAVLEDFDARQRAALVEGGDSGISRAEEINFTGFIAERDERVRAFVTRPEFVEIVTSLLGPDVDLYYNQTVFKYPEGEREFPWHQDDAYTPVEPSPYLTLWLALNDATPENGCVSVLPGSHAGGLRPHEQTNLGLVGHTNDHPDQGVLVPVEAGGIAVFWSTTLHKSGANRSKGTRKAYVIQYAKNPLKRIADGGTFEGLIPLARGGAAV